MVKREGVYSVISAFVICIIEESAGQYPGLKSLQKCNEYYKANLDPKRYTPLTQLELSRIEQTEGGPGYGFAGGLNAVPKELPFMAALGYEDGNEKKYQCGGSLISDQFILTAAHCLFSRLYGQVKFIRLGDLNLTSAADDSNAQEYLVEKFHVHPNYSFPVRYHDIALIKLDRRIKFSEYVLPICLEPIRINLRYVPLFASGWGLLGYGEDPSDFLQVGELRFYTLDECVDTFPKERSIPGGILQKYQICAGARVNISDTCEGDSGGPLFYKESYPVHRNYVAGITSFGKACALGRIPSIYTRVSTYIDWIEPIVWPDEDNKLDPNRIVFPDELEKYYTAKFS